MESDQHMRQSITLKSILVFVLGCITGPSVILLLVLVSLSLTGCSSLQGTLNTTNVAYDPPCAYVDLPAAHVTLCIEPTRAGETGE
jgi:hypothetical protein